MSIENTFERIAVALETLNTLTKQMIDGSNLKVVPPLNMPAQAVTAPAGMPPILAVQPFATNQELVAYVMQAYTTLGAEKGAGIQTVMGNLGYTNINEVQPEHFAAMKQGIDALVVA